MSFSVVLGKISCCVQASEIDRARGFLTCDRVPGVILQQSREIIFGEICISGEEIFSDDSLVTHGSQTLDSVFFGVSRLFKELMDLGLVVITFPVTLHLYCLGFFQALKLCFL